MTRLRTQANLARLSADAVRREAWGARPPRNSSETRREFRARIQRLAEEDWNAIGSEVDPVRHAQRTYRDMSPEERRRLNDEWEGVS